MVVLLVRSIEKVSFVVQSRNTTASISNKPVVDLSGVEVHTSLSTDVSAIVDLKTAESGQGPGSLVRQARSGSQDSSRIGQLAPPFRCNSVGRERQIQHHHHI